MVAITGTEEIVEQKLQAEQELLEDSLENPEFSSDLAGHITTSFRVNEQARSNAGVNVMIEESLKAFNGEYTASQLSSIGSGSKIWMNITSVKCRAVSSWIQDILVGTKAYSLGPTPVPELPAAIGEMVSELVQQEYDLYTKAKKEAMESQEGQQDPQQSPAQKTVETIKEINEFKRDLNELVLDQLNIESNEAFAPMSRAVDDSFVQGQWDKAMLEFIDDFSIYPTAILKGPVISKDKKVTWDMGNPVVTEEYKFKNKRISPMDCYPSPEAADANDGDFIEHIRLMNTDLTALAKAPEDQGYKSDVIWGILEEGPQSISLSNDNLEEVKAKEELRGTRTEANQNVYHGYHFFGAVKNKILRDWGMVDIIDRDEDVTEIEAILVNGKVIKCKCNNDPLKRRPYFIASFQQRTGAFWGTSLPWLLKSVQKMCNASGRALADNMGLSSGPQVEVATDRIASDGPIDEMYPRKIWEVFSDPAGNNGPAVRFFTVPSNAVELLAVYDRFEVMADDISMVPKYAYSNEATQGAHQTFNGLAMLLEGASKGIKACIRRIDQGVIIPRVTYEFYHIMLKGDISYSGDIEIEALGSQTLTMKATHEIKRQEFLRILTQPAVLDAVGREGILRIAGSIGEELGFTENIVPTRWELRKREEKEAEAAQAQQQAQMDMRMAPTQAQVDGQKEMHSTTQQVAVRGQDLKAGIEKAKLDVKAQGDNLRLQANIERDQKTLEKTAMQEQTKRSQTNKSVALSLKTAGTPAHDKSQQ